MREVDLPTFLRSFALKGPQIMWFLGAGTSVTSGVPTANDLVWQFKRAIFCTEEKVPLVRCRDLSSLLLRSSIQDHFDRRVGFPPINSPDEYFLLL